MSVCMHLESSRLCQKPSLNTLQHYSLRQSLSNSKGKLPASPFQGKNYRWVILPTSFYMGFWGSELCSWHLQCKHINYWTISPAPSYTYFKIILHMKHIKKNHKWFAVLRGNLHSSHWILSSVARDHYFWVLQYHLKCLLIIRNHLYSMLLILLGIINVMVLLCFPLKIFIESV